MWKQKVKTRNAMQPASRVRTVLNHDGAVMLDIEHGLMLGANPLGARIWQMLANGQSRDQIVSLISSDYHVDPAVVGQDVDDFVASLAQHHLVE
jgi:coenzyme PQQ synthesis protein D (PqqD)